MVISNSGDSVCSSDSTPLMAGFTSHTSPAERISVAEAARRKASARFRAVWSLNTWRFLFLARTQAIDTRPQSTDRGHHQLATCLDVLECRGREQIALVQSGSQVTRQLL